MLKDNIHVSAETVQNHTVLRESWPQSLTIWVSAIGMGVIAVLPRCLDLAAFTTIDEAYHWPGRVERFAAALSAGDWAATNQAGHPGVTTMWLGTLGRWLAALRGVQDPGWAGGGLGYLAMLRLPLALTNSLAVVLGYLLLRRLARPGVALLAALLWATAPFIVAHSRLLHLDGLLTSFVTLSLLSLLQIADCRLQIVSDIHRQSLIVNRQFTWLIASGLFAGLALLTKGPALILLPVVGMLLLGLTIDDRRRTMEAARRSSIIYRLSSIVYRLAARYALWLGVAALVFVLAWPAMWVAPRAALGSVLGEVLKNGGAPEPSGNYFLGQPVADPGPLFYPAVLLWRSTPLMLIGLMLYFGFTLYDVRGKRTKSKEQRTKPVPIVVEGNEETKISLQESAIVYRLSSIVGHPSSIVNGSLLFFALFFTVAMSIGPKKYDRYLLPIWPSLEILAAAGLMRIYDLRVTIYDFLKKRKPHRKWNGSRSSVLGSWFSGSLVFCSLFFVLSLNLAWYHPYYLGYFNPLLGGGRTGQYVMLAGWGEGMEQVGAWLRERPDLRAGPVLSWIYPTLAPFVPKDVLVKDLRPQYLNERTSYVVLYSRSVQRKENAEAEAYVRQFPPLFRLTAHGIDYATVHQLPRPFTDPVNVTFGAGLRLRGFSTAQLGSTLVITPSWGIEADGPGGRFAFMHLLDDQGHKVAQVDAPLDQGMFARWQTGQQFDSPFPLALPADLPPGRYRVVLGVYDPASGARLPVQGGTPLPESLDGPEVLELTQITRP